MLGTRFDPLCVRSDMPERLGTYGARCCANERKESLPYSVCVLIDKGKKIYISVIFLVFVCCLKQWGQGL